MADRVDEALQDYMKDRRASKGPGRPESGSWSGVSGRPEDEALIRRAARMATRRGGDLVARARDPRGRPVRDVGAGCDPDPGARRSAASFHEVIGQGIPDALLDFARAENITQIVMGASHAIALAPSSRAGR